MFHCGQCEAYHLILRRNVSLATLMGVLVPFIYCESHGGYVNYPLKMYISIIKRVIQRFLTKMETF